MKRTVAIVGSHSSGRSTAPFDDPSKDIWVFNAVASPRDTWVTRLDALFQMHRSEVYRSPYNREDPYHWRWLQQKHDFPIYMLELDHLVPACVPYPLEQVTSVLLPNWKIDGEEKEYYSSTIDYAIALAIYLAYERIEIHGVMMSSNTEYTYQRTGLALWTGIALGRGIELDHIGGGEIYDRPLYGYGGNIAHSLGELENRTFELHQKRKAQYTQALKIEMQLDDTWKRPADLPQVIGALRNAREMLGYLDGALEEAERYRNYAQARAEASQPYYMDRNEHEEAGAAAQNECNEQDRLVKETAGAINVALAHYITNRDPNTLKWLKKFVYQHLDHAEALGHANGILSENLRMMRQIDQAITAAGGQKALEMIQAEAVIA